jgi:Citrate synthase, C-terminal domain
MRGAPGFADVQCTTLYGILLLPVAERALSTPPKVYAATAKWCVPLGIPRSMFRVMFAIARTVGWVASAGDDFASGDADWTRAAIVYRDREAGLRGAGEATWPLGRGARIGMRRRSAFRVKHL